MGYTTAGALGGRLCYGEGRWGLGEIRFPVSDGCNEAFLAV